MVQREGVGVDFGTSNSVIATYDGDATRLIPVEDGQSVLPSAIYIDRKRHNQTGHAAIDIGLPGQLFRGVKRLLGNADQDRVMVFDQPYRLVALITPILQRLRATFSTTAGVGCHVGRPVNFEGHSDHSNAIALDRLLESCGYAGFDVSADLAEPIAATIAYVSGVSLDRGRILTFDFGGGTLDLVVVGLEPVEHVIAAHGVALGGDHIDQLLFRKLLFPLLGKGEVWRRHGVDRMIETVFPFELYEELLLNWQRSYLLNQGAYQARVADQIAAGGEPARKFRRLYDLVLLNQTFEVFQAIREVKETLSSRGVALLDLPQIDVELEVTREWFDQLIEPMLARVDHAMTVMLEAADLADADIDVVVCTGGSSLIAAVQDRLHARFGNRIQAYDPFASVARGLAIADYRARTA